MATDIPAPQAAPAPRRRRRYIIILGAGIFFLVFLGVWLFSPVQIDEAVPGTIKTNDLVQVQPGVNGKPNTIRNLGSVKPGDIVSVEEGNVGFLLLQGGVIGRLEGPASVKLVESRRQVDAPSVIQGLLAQRAGTDPLGGTTVRTALALDILSGTVAIKTGQAKANASFKLQAANLYSPIQGATIQVTVLPEEVVWDTLEGEPTLGMVSGPSGEEAPVVISKTPRNLRLAIPVPPETSQATESYRRYDASMREMVDLVSRGETSLKAGGLDYEEFVDPSGLVYLASVVAGKAEAQETFATESFDPPSAEEVVAVPGQEVRLITDSDIQTAVPAGITLHILPGNALRLTMGGIPYTVRAAIASGRLELQGLPLGLDPSAYFGELPALLSLETEEGIARVTYLPEELPPPSQQTAAEQVVEEGALPHTAPFFAAIPTPLQVSLDWNVATTNLVIVALLALVLRVSVAASTHILSGYEAQLRKYLGPALELWRPVADAVVKFMHRVPHLLTTVAGNAVTLLVVNGVLFAFLDARFKPWAGVGMQVFPLMLLGMAGVTMVDLAGRARALSRWNVSYNFGFNPANFFLGVMAVVVSRGFRLSPGLMVGSSTALKVPTLKSLPLEQRSRYFIAGLRWTAAFGLVAWFATLLLPLAAGNPISANLVQLLRGPLGLIQDICLLAFTACLARVFAALLPVPNSPGLTIATYNRVGWVIGFLASGFLFFHLILNKNSGITKLLQERGYILVPLVVLSLAATLALYIASKVVAAKAAAAAKS